MRPVPAAGRARLGRWLTAAALALVAALTAVLTGRPLLFKGNSLAYVWQDIAGIVVLGLALFAVSVWRFSRLIR